MNNLPAPQNDHDRDLPFRFIFSDWKIWVVFFAYTFLLGLFIQFILLPHIFPSWHEGNGLLKGYDYSEFHRLATDLADQIRAEGWSVWEPTPGGQFVSGIAAIFYALITPKPWTLLLLNAALHASAALVLLKMMMRITDDRGLACVATLPFVIFPSALTWTSQIHNDSYAVLGVLCFIYGWMVIIQPQAWKSNSRFTIVLLLVLLGTLFIWPVRPFVVEVLYVFSVLAALALAIALSIAALRKRISWRRLPLLFVAPWALVVAITSFSSISVEGVYNCVRDLESCQSQEDDLMSLNQISKNPSRLERAENLSEEVQVDLQWYETPWMPEFVDQRLKALSLEREINLFLWSHAKSNVDEDVKLNSALEMMIYAPRAIEIALLAPFPSDWLGEGSRESSTLMRRISAFEMVWVYLSLVLFPYGLLRWRRSHALWMMLWFCVGMICVYSIATPNIGTLYRFRFPFLMPIVGLGVASGILIIRRIWTKREK